MAERGYIKIKINRAINRMFNEYCSANSIDTNTFIEEAIMEKIEVERLSKELDYYSEPEEAGVIGVEEETTKNSKRTKH
jgi:hypothetical protein